MDELVKWLAKTIPTDAELRVLEAERKKEEQED